VIEALHEVQRSLKGGGSAPHGPLAQALRAMLDSWPAGEYDQNDWAVALRFLVASAKRHRRVDGPRGYLDFVAHYAPFPGDSDQ